MFVKCCYKIDLKTLDKCLIQDKVVIFKNVADHLNTILLIICKTENNIMILLGFSINTKMLYIYIYTHIYIYTYMHKMMTEEEKEGRGKKKASFLELSI